MASNRDPIRSYFAAYAHFTYDAASPAVEEFNRLAEASGWNPTGKACKRERKRFVDAFVTDVNNMFGEGRANLDDWQMLCSVCQVRPIPPSITKCRKALSNVYVNIFDAMEALKHGGMAQRFSSITELRSYTIDERKVIPRDKAKMGGALKDLLRRLL